MAFHLATLELATDKKLHTVNLTQRVRAEVKASGIENGLCSIYIPHTTAAVTINENTDPDVQTDILNALERAIPKAAQYYKHDTTSTKRATRTRTRRPR
jgi:secondary thiamine-phosphate synthase enzyme